MRSEDADIAESGIWWFSIPSRLEQTVTVEWSSEQNKYWKAVVSYFPKIGKMKYLLYYIVILNFIKLRVWSSSFPLTTYHRTRIASYITNQITT